MKPNEPTFGADAYGLVWGYRFAAGQPARPITIEGAATFMAAPAQEVRDAFL
jgi:hypothetical protein